jgi:hypothetical protein
MKQEAGPLCLLWQLPAETYLSEAGETLREIVVNFSYEVSLFVLVAEEAGLKKAPPVSVCFSWNPFHETVSSTYLTVSVIVTGWYRTR